MARFGTFELDSHRQRRRGEQHLYLTPRAFDLLSILIDAATELIRIVESPFRG
jgi:DNA-binding winged helix-turn-helix (wHTH) protein